MRITPNEQAQEALQFTALAVGILLVLRFGLATALHLVPLPPPDALVASANGYHADHILRQPGTVVMGAWPWMARLALAALVASLCAVVVAIVFSGLAALSGRSGAAWALPAARVTLLVCGAWCLAAVFVLPPHSIRFSNSGVVITERTAILGQLSLPGKATVQAIDWHAIRSVEPWDAGEGEAVRIVLLTGQDILVEFPDREGDEPGTSVGVPGLMTQIDAVRSGSAQP